MLRLMLNMERRRRRCCGSASPEQKRMPVDEAVAHMDAMVGLFLTRLSGFAARCGGRDLAARRVIDRAVFDLRVEISEAAAKMADQCDEPQDARTMMPDAEVRQQIERADSFIADFRAIDRGDGC